jgi:hypothetical protein
MAGIDLQSILAQYLNAQGGTAQGDALDHYEQVAQHTTGGQLGEGLAEAFRSDATPPFEQMVSQLFGRSNGMQQAGVLNQILATVGPAILAAVAGNVMGRLTQGQHATPTASSTASSTAAQPISTQITPDQASKLSPTQVEDIVKQAAARDPSVMDRLSNYYAEHPGLVKTLGGAALAIALAKIANNMKR